MTLLPVKSCALLLIPVLGACGGGGATGSQDVSIPEDVYASGNRKVTDPDASDVVFPVDVAIATETAAGASANRERWGLRIVDDATVHLIRDGEIIVLTKDTDFGSTDGSTIYGLSYDAPAQLGGLSGTVEGPGTSSVFFGTFGFETMMETVSARSSEATYGGNARFVTGRGGETGYEVGTTRLVVNFDDETAIGTVMGFEDGSALTLAGGTLTGNGFSGKLDVSGPMASVWTLNDSDVEGSFYGPEASLVGGTYAGSGTADGAAADFTGTFYGEEAR